MDLLEDAMDEVEGGAVVHGDDDYAAEDRAEERGDPLGGVFAPDHDAVAFDDAARGEAAGEGMGEVEDLGVGEGFGAVSAALADSGVEAVRVEMLIEQLG